MTDNPVPREQQFQPNNAGNKKKLYQKPAFRHEQVFETQALSCGKLVSGINACQFSSKTS